MDQVLVSGYQGWHFSGGNLQGNYWLADEVAALLSQYQHRNLPVGNHCAGKTGIACIRAVLPEYFIAVGRRLWQEGGHEQQCRRVERSEEHTSELQSRPHLVCRLLLEKKKIVKDA